ncbi:FHA domain-containing protein [Actinokineospora auranticolor]|uniref:Serine/threonine protein phosphatase PrpC n=1 Tax=Actinokineospora auranticolor TaxID=155976 RepID=A0A2S6GKU5_9PSEU|nr:FHA domain-containing protein [Actinokineospora auranticolor]PPK65864.1 serine/threonine protein phosphatase PrpC [Actinokineospora auranticolor]
MDLLSLVVGFALGVGAAVAVHLVRARVTRPRPVPPPRVDEELDVPEVVRPKESGPAAESVPVAPVPAESLPAKELASAELEPATELAPTVTEQLPVETTEVIPADPVTEALAVTEFTPGTGLAWLRGDGDFLISRATTLVGRSATCDLVVDEDLVSRRHFRVVRDERGWWLESFDTPNGTYLNDRPIRPNTPVRLQGGDRIGLGDTELTLILPTTDTPAESGIALSFNSFGASITGGRRSNQDVCHWDNTMVAVADGVGGRPAGGLAAKLAVDGIRDAGQDQDLLATARRVNEVVRATGEENVLATGLATTLDVAVLRPGPEGYLVAGLHIGDGTVIVQLGAELEDLVEAHSSTAVGSGAGGKLLRAVGLDETIRPDRWDRPARLGQRYLLASDGLVNALGHQPLRRALVRLRADEPRECVRRLLELADRAGAADNVTVVVADVTPTEDR